MDQNTDALKMCVEAMLLSQGMNAPHSVAQLAQMVTKADRFLFPPSHRESFDEAIQRQTQVMLEIARRIAS